MPKLLQICVEGNTGSTGRIAEGIGNYVQNYGWESYIAHGRFPRPSSSNIIRIGTKFDVFFHGILTRLFDMHGLGSKLATKRLIKKIEFIKPDLIHLHHLHGYYINIEILFNYLKDENIPVVWTFHDCWSFTGHCAHFDFIGCNKWKTACFKCPQKTKYPASYIFDRSKKNFYLKKKLFTSLNNLTIVSVSNWLDKIVSESFFRDTNHIVIYNGIDTKIFKPNKIGVRNKYNLTDKFLILGVANTWDTRKGLDDFIELSSMLKENEIIFLIGLDQKQLKYLPQNIQGIKRTENQSELRDFYSSADIFFNPSVEETFGLTTAESLSCGTPAIVYNSTASPEIIDDKTGFLVEKKDINMVLESIKKIKKTGKNRYVSDCVERVNNRFNIKKNHKEYFLLYDKLLNKKMK